MKILKSWLKDYIDFDFSDEELAEKLSMSGSSVESIEKGIDDNVIIVEIRKIDRHPNADRLNLATVYDGELEQTVVCGASNIKVGQKVPLARIGAKLPGGVIKKAVIRGVESEGMICAADELGFGDDHSGIIILPDEYEIGQKLSHYAGKESVFDFEITPNRGDCLSHIGVAREVAAILGKKIKNTIKNIEPTESGEIKITLESPDLCNQYFACLIKGIKIQESPKWLKDRLELIGAKSINNIVDITNYILFDLGQPLHAFDTSKIAENNIIVRKSSQYEKIQTLDGVARDLPEDTLVIADNEKAIAVAGIMGGANSEVDEKTTSIILESAEFDRKSVRKSAKALKLTSEASYRFERGVDTLGVEPAFMKAISLITEMAGGEIACITRAGNPCESQKIKIEYDRINNLLGAKLPKEKINQILEGLGFVISDEYCTIPSWRNDIGITEDLVDEVGRISGYGLLEISPLEKSTQPPKSLYYKKEYLKDILLSCGFSEVMNYAFLSGEDAKIAHLSEKSLLAVANPLQPENKYLRNSIIPALLKNIAKNPSFDPILFYEIGHVFEENSEKTVLSLAASGKDSQRSLLNALAEIENICEKKIEVREISTDELNRFKIRKPAVFVAEIDLEPLLSKIEAAEFRTAEESIHYRPISKYPSISRDLAFIVNNKTDGAQIADAIYAISEKIHRVEQFDEYASDKFGVNMKNLAFHIYLSDMEKTMVDSEANQVIESVVESVNKKFNAKLRD